MGADAHRHASDIDAAEAVHQERTHVAAEQQDAGAAAAVAAGGYDVAYFNSGANTPIAFQLYVQDGDVDELVDSLTMAFAQTNTAPS